MQESSEHLLGVEETSDVDKRRAIKTRPDPQMRKETEEITVKEPKEPVEHAAVSWRRERDNDLESVSKPAGGQIVSDLLNDLWKSWNTPWRPGTHSAVAGFILKRWNNFNISWVAFRETF